MPSFLNSRSQRRKQEQERRDLQAKRDREARALAALAEELGWGDPSRRESDVGTLGGSTLIGSIEQYDSEESQSDQRPTIGQLTVEEVAAVRWRAHTPELVPERSNESNGQNQAEHSPARPRSIRFASGT